MVESTNQKSPKDEIPIIIKNFRETNKGKSLKQLHDLYFVIMEQLIEADKKSDINSLLMHCQASLGLIESLIKYTITEYGNFDIHSIPAIEKASIYFAVLGNYGQLQNIKDIVEYFDELTDYRELVDESFIRADLANKIYQIVKENPNFLQVDLKKRLNFDDGAFISATVYYMDKIGKLIKRKSGNKIYLTIK